MTSVSRFIASGTFQSDHECDDPTRPTAQVGDLRQPAASLITARNALLSNVSGGTRMILHRVGETFVGKKTPEQSHIGIMMRFIKPLTVRPKARDAAAGRSGETSRRRCRWRAEGSSCSRHAKDEPAK